MSQNEYDLIQNAFAMRGTILNYGIDSHEFQLNVTFPFLTIVLAFRNGLESLPVRYPNKPANTILYQGASAKRHSAVGEPSGSRRGAVEVPPRSRRGAVEEPSRSRRGAVE